MRGRVARIGLVVVSVLSMVILPAGGAGAEDLARRVECSPWQGFR